MDTLLTFPANFLETTVIQLASRDPWVKDWGVNTAWGKLLKLACSRIDGKCVGRLLKALSLLHVCSALSMFALLLTKETYHG